MNNSLLNATPFSGSAIRIDSQFRSLLVCCIKIYNDIIAKNKRTKNDEETIRDLFFDEYLNDDNYRNQNKELEVFHFEKEPKENIGYLDIKAKKLNPYVSTKAYFIIECKRLDSNNLSGNTGLNAEYVKNGVCRFVTDYYSSYFGCNAMFGFVVESVNIQTDIVDNINSMLTKDFTNAQGLQVNANATQVMQYEKFVCGYPYSYISKHAHISGKEIDLYHLMFDLSSNIQ